ncbi:MAG: lysophospholipase [Candidatus Omnitrophica bacterium]|nr:lysophospholipase [Candidatus Omnitrophota bacterium]MCA9423776.1 lysophospholipase [Candidatus Omnitrophota bacterium]MCA9434570.1 lysophospholipase [Candidatus Omnitrophota bacterium]MCA9446724.1 lysophospholipase [Candidatus Omnitrophota bacterium]MCB9770104.1 lysophospholipase [Candidatus Omnitrophota bacterium]
MKTFCLAIAVWHSIKVRHNTIRKYCIVAAIVSALVSFSSTEIEARPEILKLEINNQTHLTYRRYVSDNPRGLILYLHGISSHSGWYIQSGEIFAENGYTVYAPDRRGSGMNDYERGHLQDYLDLIADMDAFIARMRADFPGLPIYIFGLSWGGKQALLYDSLRPNEFAGVILSCPGIKPKIDLSLWNKLKVLLYFWRRREVQPEIKIPISDASLFTDNVRWQNWIEQDPYTLRRATARFYWESHQMDKVLKREVRDGQSPVLLQLAGRDEIVNNKKTQKFIDKLVGKRGKRDVEVLMYEDARHTLEFEDNLPEVMRDILEWLDRHNRW